MKFTIRGRLDGLNEYTAANRQNRYAGAAMKKKNQQAVAFALMGHNERYDRPVQLRCVWYEPNKRRDIDNVAFAKKFILDALVEHGTIKGDGWEYVAGFTDEFHVDKENPRVEVELQ